MLENYINPKAQLANNLQTKREEPPIIEIIIPQAKFYEPNSLQSPDVDSLGIVPPQSNHDSSSFSDSTIIDNVLLLALSSFKDGELRETENCAPNFYYNYQLEPIVRTLLHKKELAGQTWEIILLSTPKTEQTHLISARINNQTVHYRTSQDEKISVIDFFSYRILNPVEDSVDSRQQAVSAKISAEKVRLYKVLIQDDYSECGQDTLISGFVDIIDEIKRLHNLNPKLNLYVDTHGGPRTNQNMLNSVLSLLAHEIPTVSGNKRNHHSASLVKAEQIYTCEVDDKAHQNIISNAGREFLLQDFVSGINECIYYGRIQSLENYAQKTSNQAEHELINALKQVTSDIMICNVDDFSAHLLDLSNKINQITDRNSYFYIVKDILTSESGYGSLLLEHTPFHEIQWCLRKGFYMQALAIIESRIPQYVKHHNLLFNGPKEKNPSKNNGVEIIRPFDESKKHHPKLDEKGCFQLSQRVIEMNNNNWKEPFQEVFDSYLRQKFGAGKKIPKKNKTPNVAKTIIYSIEPYEPKEDFTKFLKATYELKNIRNNVLHGYSSGKEKKSLQSIHDKIKNYLDLANNLDFFNNL